jgi:hypothetical protein
VENPKGVFWITNPSTEKKEVLSLSAGVLGEMPHNDGQKDQVQAGFLAAKRPRGAGASLSPSYSGGGSQGKSFKIIPKEELIT